MAERATSSDLRRADEESGNYVIDEKANDAAHVEDAKEKNMDISCGLSPAEQKKVMSVFLQTSSLTVKPANSSSRRIDLRLLPILGIMYSISLIDRTNLGLALVAGMQEDLGLAVGNRYTVIVMVFFVAYM